MTNCCVCFTETASFRFLCDCCALLASVWCFSLSRYCSTLLLQQVAGLDLLLGQSNASGV